MPRLLSRLLLLLLLLPPPRAAGMENGLARTPT
jgi:hypothetical protein